MQFNWDVVAHGAMLLMLVAYIVKDIFWLRLLTVIGCIFVVTYFYLGTENPFWIFIGWNLAFIGINAFQIKLLLKEKLGYRLTSEEEYLYNSYFHEMKRTDFIKIIKLAKWRTMNRGDKVFNEGDTVREIMLLQTGYLAVQIKDKTIARLTEGHIIGEMSFVAGEQATATIQVDSDTAILLTWSQQEMHQLMEKNTEMRIIMQSFFSRDLMKKLQQLSQQETK